MKVKTRIAPSPTGNMHIGTARSALFNYLFARKHGGEFILRIEDTDLERSKKEYEDSIIDGMKWLGFEWDGQIYRQSERLAIYKEALKELMASGKAFWCHHTVKELEDEKEGQMAAKLPPRHICSDKGTAKAKEKGEIIRLAVDAFSERKIMFEDIIRGTVQWTEGHIGDLSLAKDLDTPLYNFANVIDDFELEITHVIRGEEHLSNTPKQLLIYEALGKKPPLFAHMPLILAPDRSKMSKRDGATSLVDYKKDYLPEALNNFLGFMGFTYSREIMSLENMVNEFELEKVHKSGAVFNVEKLNWLNAQYVRKLSPDDFRKFAGLPELSNSAVPFITERLEKLTDVKEFEYFWKNPKFEKDLLIWKKSDSDVTLSALKLVMQIFDRNELPSAQQLDEIASTKFNSDRGAVYWPLRVALSGKEKSAGPLDIMTVRGAKDSAYCVKHAIKLLSDE